MADDSLTGELTTVDLSRDIGEITGEDGVRYGVLLSDLPDDYAEGDRYAFQPIRIAFSRQPLATELKKVGG